MLGQKLCSPNTGIWVYFLNQTNANTPKLCTVPTKGQPRTNTLPGSAYRKDSDWAHQQIKNYKENYLHVKRTSREGGQLALGKILKMFMKLIVYINLHGPQLYVALERDCSVWRSSGIRFRLNYLGVLCNHSQCNLMQPRQCSPPSRRWAAASLSPLMQHYSSYQFTQLCVKRKVLFSVCDIWAPIDRIEYIHDIFTQIAVCSMGTQTKSGCCCQFSVWDSFHFCLKN